MPSEMIEHSKARASVQIPPEAVLDIIPLAGRGYAVVARTLAVEWLRVECRFQHEACFVRDAIENARREVSE